MRLALGLGKTLGELVVLITPAELELWVAFAEVDGPWWGKREEIMLAQISQFIAAQAGQAEPLDRFIPQWSPAPKALLSFEDGIAMLARSHGVSI